MKKFKQILKAVCDGWHNYVEFRNWAITHGYNDDLTIDRIENEKGYDASNCRWATMREQQNNKRSNHIVYLKGVGHTISEWAEILWYRQNDNKDET